LLRHYADPEARARQAKIINRNRDKAFANPEIFARLQEVGRRHVCNLTTPEAVAKRIAACKLAGPKISDARLPWCPRELRPRYRALCKTRRYSTAEARAIVEREAADLAAIRSGHLDDALFWLNRIAPVKRLDDGTYRYGSAILTPGQLIDRAKLKGWQPMGVAA
jgi:hypothetical protein